MKKLCSLSVALLLLLCSITSLAASTKHYLIRDTEGNKNCYYIKTTSVYAQSQIYVLKNSAYDIKENYVSIPYMQGYPEGYSCYLNYSNETKIDGKTYLVYQVEVFNEKGKPEAAAIVDYHFKLLTSSAIPDETLVLRISGGALVDDYLAP